MSSGCDFTNTMRRKRARFSRERTHAEARTRSSGLSEWGFVQCEDLRRSEEILTGAIPSAKDGIVIVETTWRGGRGGHLWDIVKKALETPEGAEATR